MVRYAKTDEPVHMTIWTKTRVGPWNHVEMSEETGPIDVLMYPKKNEVARRN